MNRIIKETLKLLGLLLGGFVLVFLIGLQFGLNGEGDSVSAVTILCFFYIVGTVPIVLVTFPIVSMVWPSSFRARAAVAFGMGLGAPILFMINGP